MTTATAELSPELADELNTFLLRTPKADRAELAEYVQTRAAALDRRQLTSERLSTLVGEGWRRLGTGPVDRECRNCRKRGRR